MGPSASIPAASKVVMVRGFIHAPPSEYRRLIGQAQSTDTLQFSLLFLSTKVAPPYWSDSDHPDIVRSLRRSECGRNHLRSRLPENPSHNFPALRQYSQYLQCWYISAAQS